MKHLYYWVALLTTFFVVSDVFAQEVQPENISELAGVWQVCAPNSNPSEGVIRTAPYLKILGKNGELSNIAINGGGGVSVLTATGTYRQTSDSTYVESIGFAIDEPLKGKDNLLKYKLVDNKFLHLQFHVGESSILFNECWVRISTPTAEQLARNKVIMQKQREDGVFFTPEVMPVYPGGMQAMMEYINQKLIYPKEAQEKGLKGLVLVQFVVDTEGNVTAAKVLRGVDPLLDAEALKVITTMPRWTPGKDKGVAVPVLYTIPIHFKLPATPKTQPLVAIL